MANIDQDMNTKKPLIEEERVPTSLEAEMLKLEDISVDTEGYRRELLSKMMDVTRSTEINSETLANKGSREAITAMVKMAADLINDTESSQHKRIAAKTRLKEAAGNDKIAELGVELIKQFNRGDVSAQRDLPIDLENVELELGDDEKIPQTMLRTDPNDIRE